jgi:hypothetical protein
MPIGPSAQPAHVLDGLANFSFVYLEYTVLSGALTAVKQPKGWALGNFSSGVAALTFPAYFEQVFPFIGNENTDNASATSRHHLVAKTVNLALGTASVRCIDDNDGTTENPVDGTIKLLFAVAG